MKKTSGKKGPILLATARIVLSVVPLFFFFSCAEHDGANSEKAPLEEKVVQVQGIGSPTQEYDIEKQIDEFVTDHLLGGIAIDKMYEVDKLKADFGKYQEVSQEPANIDYEGMKGNHLNKYRYNEFDLVFYVVENDREIFAYLEIHDDVVNPMGEVGASMKSVEAKYSGKLKRRSDSLYTIALSGRNYLSGLKLIAKNGFLEKIRVDLGEI